MDIPSSYLFFWRVVMRYLKPHIPNIKIGDNEYNILFSLDNMSYKTDKFANIQNS